MELGSNSHGKGMKMTEFKDSVMLAKPLPYTTAQGEEISILPDYKRLLVESMLGLTHRGCQWCLQLEPGGSIPQVCPQLNMRLCEWCYSRNALPIEALNKLSLRPGIDLSPLHPQSHYYGNEPIYWMSPGRKFTELRGVWKPRVQRLVKAQLGDDALLDDLLDEEYTVLHNLSIQQLESGVTIKVLRSVKDVGYY